MVDPMLQDPVTKYLQGRDKNPRLLHPDYVRAITGKDQAKWFSFLTRDLGVWTIPRLVEEKDISLDFQYIIEHVQPKNTFLEVLRNNWARYEKEINANAKIRQKLRKTPVLCEDGKERPLELTFLPIPVLKVQEGLQFVKITNPNDYRWLQLAELGVTIKAGLEFYLGCLQSVQNKNMSKQKAHDLYRRIYEKLIEGKPGLVQYVFVLLLSNTNNM